MASSLISAVGTLSNSSSNLRILILSDSSKGLISQKKCCWMKLQSYKKPEQSFGSSYASSNGIFERRKVLLLSAFGFLVRGFQIAPENGVAVAAEYADMPALRGKDYGKTKMRFPDYTETKSGLQYKDLRVGSGSTPKIGDTVVVDWDGYTIGYYGRIFEARNKTKGGSFEGGDKDFMKFTLGLQQVIPAFEEAVSGMSPGGVRRSRFLCSELSAFVGHGAMSCRLFCWLCHADIGLDIGATSYMGSRFLCSELSAFVGCGAMTCRLFCWLCHVDVRLDIGATSYMG